MSPELTLDGPLAEKADQLAPRLARALGAEADAERRALAHRGRDLSDMMRSAYFD
jgi:hypothetical protein